jgi:arginase
MKLAIILAPYDSGYYHGGCGRGPDAIVAGGLVEELTLHGHDVVVADIGEIGDEQGREISTGFAVCSAISEKITASRKDGRFPVVLCGNCLTAVGAVAGESADSIVWADQHGDLNTPETSTYGFLDGMALATVIGLCWRPMANAVPGFKPLEASRCVLVDARDLDAGEKHTLEGLPILHGTCAEAPGLAGRLAATGGQRTHLHIDLDIHDPEVLQANRYAWPGGPSPDELRESMRAVAASLPVVGITISAYDPAFDAKGDVPPAVGRLLVDVLDALRKKA